MRARDRVRVLVGLASLTLLAGACSWDPRHPFEREAPDVKKALSALDAGDGAAAASMLEDYLGTGECREEGKIGTPPLLKKRPDGTFDLGLSLFAVGESFGRRLGEEEEDSGLPETVGRERDDQVECALAIVRSIAGDEDQSIELRARARYLEGNLLFLRKDYKAAVRAYDEALVLAPGVLDGGDPVGRDAAWNRSIALRRIQDKEDAGDKSDASQDASNDAASDAPNDGGDGGKDGGGDSGGDSGNDSGGDGGSDSGGGDGGNDASSPPPPPPPKDEPDAGAPPPSTENQDDRILDQLERAPTVQQEAAKKNAAQHRVRGMADK